jgi:hypothetical protein
VAKPQVGNDGLIHACYRVKGKPKGAVRVVPSARSHCRRGERRAAWSVAGQGGQQGGQQGTVGTAGTTGAGQQGANGTNGSSGSDGSSEAALKTQVASLNLKIDALEKTLEGVTHGDLVSSLLTLEGLDNADLLGAVDATEGLTNSELTEAVQSLPVVDALCEQNEELTKQINTIAGVVQGLGLSPALEVIGLLKIPTLPPALDPFTCGTP